jgi:Protein of unknown function (DUF3768)
MGSAAPPWSRGGGRALGPDEVSAVLAAVASFSAFDADNDPYGEHDCAVLTVGAERVIWKSSTTPGACAGTRPTPPTRP